MKKFTAHASANKKRTLDERGLVRTNLTLFMPIELRDFLDAETERQGRSLSSIAMEQLKKYRSTMEKIREQ